MRKVRELTPLGGEMGGRRFYAKGGFEERARSPSYLARKVTRLNVGKKGAAEGMKRKENWGTQY